MHIPLPPRWNREVDGLDMADFFVHAQDFERGLLPKGLIFPREGQIWRALRDCEVGFMAWFAHGPVATVDAPPLPPCGAASFPKAEEVRILADTTPKPLSIRFVPVRYAYWETRIIPQGIRSLPGYSHFELNAPTAKTFGISKSEDYFTECFELAAGQGKGSENP